MKTALRAFALAAFFVAPAAAQTIGVTPQSPRPNFVPTNTANPAVTDDNTKSYSVGSPWITPGNCGIGCGLLFQNWGNATGAAKWAGLPWYDTNDNIVGGYTLGNMNGVTGTANIALGTRSLRTLTAGSRNVSIGADAGRSIDAGIENVFVGNLSGFSVTSDQGHVFIGYNVAPTMNANTGGIGNWDTCVGHSSCFLMTVGGSNAALGRAAMRGETSGGFNVAMGHASLFSGSSNTSVIGIGNSSGGGALNGSDGTFGWNGDTDSIAIGRLAGKTANSNMNNAVAIGAAAAVGAANTVQIGHAMANIVSAGVPYLGKVATTVNNAAGQTLTAASMVGGVIVRSGHAGVTDTMATAALIVAAMPGAEVGTSFEMMFVNQGSGTLTFTAGSNTTFATSAGATASVAATTTKIYIGIITNVGTPTIIIYG